MTHQFRVLHRDTLGLFYRNSLPALQDLLSFQELVILFFESSSFEEFRSETNVISVILL